MNWTARHASRAAAFLLLFWAWSPTRRAEEQPQASLPPWSYPLLFATLAALAWLHFRPPARRRECPSPLAVGTFFVAVIELSHRYSCLQILILALMAGELVAELPGTASPLSLPMHSATALPRIGAPIEAAPMRLLVGRGARFWQLMLVGVLPPATATLVYLKTDLLVAALIGWGVLALTRNLAADFEDDSIEIVLGSGLILLHRKRFGRMTTTLLGNRGDVESLKLDPSGRAHFRIGSSEYRLAEVGYLFGALEP